jgi:chemotaxis signal transduction protein
MTPVLNDIERRLAELRRAFDDSFAQPPPPAPGPGDWVEFLLIQAGEQPYALRIGELSGLESDRKIVPLPAAPGSTAPWLLGLCAVRGQLAPVFDLAAILGLPPPLPGGPGARKESPRWMVLYRDRLPALPALPALPVPPALPAVPAPPATATELLALAFDGFQGTRRLAARDIHPLNQAGGPAALAPQAIQVEGRPIHVADLAAVAARIRQAVQPKG